MISTNLGRLYDGDFWMGGGVWVRRAPSLDANLGLLLGREGVPTLPPDSFTGDVRVVAEAEPDVDGLGAQVEVPFGVRLDGRKWRCVRVRAGGVFVDFDEVGECAVV